MGYCDYILSCSVLNALYNGTCAFLIPSTVSTTSLTANLPALSSTGPNIWNLMTTESGCNSSFIYVDGSIYCFKSENGCTVELPAAVEQPEELFLLTDYTSTLVWKNVGVAPFFSLLSIGMNQTKLQMVVQPNDPCIRFPESFTSAENSNMIMVYIPSANQPGTYRSQNDVPPNSVFQNTDLVCDGNGWITQANCLRVVGFVIPDRTIVTELHTLIPSVTLCSFSLFFLLQFLI